MMSRGFIRRRLGDLTGALAAFDAVLAADPKLTPALNLRAHVRYLMGDISAAIADHERALESEPDDPATLNHLAWIYATCRDESLRQPVRALELANKACFLTENRNPGYLDTLAAAQAAAGRFADAAQTEDTAMQMVPEAERELYRGRLEQYRRGEKYVDLGDG
jgi:tetratricopeptide (TPR) repeat protein